jgi:hypothetical protein
MACSVDTELTDLRSAERTREVLRGHFPEWRGDPHVQSVLSLSLRQIASTYPMAGITQQSLEGVDRELRTL